LSRWRGCAAAPETLLSVGQDEARAWIEGDQQLVGRIAAYLDRALSRPDEQTHT
jgi:hypothetical protein